MILVKRGVVIANLQDERVLEPAYVADRIWRENGWGDVTITGGIDGNHATGSFHYGAAKKRGQALDLRLPSFKTGDRHHDTAAVGLLRDALPGRQVILETDHIHVEPAP